MNSKIIDLNEEIQKRMSVKKPAKKLNVDDIFNLLLIYKHREQILSSFDLNFVERAFGRYKNMERFSSILSNLETECNENGEEIISFRSTIDRKIREKNVVLINGEVVILGDDEYFDSLKREYDEETFSVFDNIYFFIYNDLEYGFDNWKVLFEDEYIKDPKYPGIVTGEFIGQKKDANVMKQVRKRAIERIKNNYK